MHYPRAGQTILINGIQFINGVAETPSLPVYHERYYNVKDHPPYIVGESDPEELFAVGGEIKNVNPALIGENTTDSFVRKEVFSSLGKDMKITSGTIQDVVVSITAEDNAEADLRNLVEARKAIIEAKAEAAAREEALVKAEPKASPFAMNPNKKSSKPIDAKYERNPSMSYVEQMNTYGTWGEMRKFVMLSVGRDINDKKEAIKALEYLDNQK